MFDAMLHGTRIDDPALVINELSAMLLAARNNLAALSSNLQVKLFAARWQPVHNTAHPQPPSLLLHRRMLSLTK